MKSLILAAGVALATFAFAGNANADHNGYRGGYYGGPYAKPYRYGPSYYPGPRYGYYPPPVRPYYPNVYYGSPYRYWGCGSPYFVQPGFSIGFNFVR